ncbi:alpha/beta fold hydrolase [Luteimonas salinilitoris]|uniref:Alpha/beta fold hydrolase n=1 Tax=Luteimonas salinilitoris TaxID=3237697 RepID=A0ABV4HRI2_9GAMM
MATFVLIHGAGDVGWSWHLVEAELRARGHDVVAPDLPCEDETKGLEETADMVVREIGGRRDLVVVGHSFGGFIAPLIADRRPVEVLVYLAGMIPAPGERPADWWDNTGYAEAAKKQAARDGGLTGNDDPFISFYNGVPRELAEEALSRERGQSNASYHKPWPLRAHPDVPTKIILCKDDHLFPAAFFRRLGPERLGVVPDEVPGCHCVALSHPRELADQLESYLGK